MDDLGVIGKCSDKRMFRGDWGTVEVSPVVNMKGESIKFVIFVWEGGMERCWH